MKPKVGQILYSLNVGNASRNQEQKLTPTTVEKVGRKYFTCCPEGGGKWQRQQYTIDGWCEKTIYSAGSVLYANPQDWENEKEEARICRVIADSFQYGRNCLPIPLNQLQAIETILATYWGAK